MHNPEQPLPILYSFRRCPYAIRARMALKYSQTNVVLREVKLSSKPENMLAISPKGTVPVLQLPDNIILEESMDIIHWALSHQDPEDWLLRQNDGLRSKALTLISDNDQHFKKQLDLYKYADRHPERPATYYRQTAMAFLQQLEGYLLQNNYLINKHISIADIAIFPFIRQFAFVDKDWFDQSKLPGLQTWLQQFIDSELFASCMEKHPPWTSEQPAVIF